MTAAAAPSQIPDGESLGLRAFRLLKKNRYALVCFSIVILYVLTAALGWLGWLPDFQERVGGSYDPPYGQSCTQRASISVCVGSSPSFASTSSEITVADAFANCSLQDLRSIRRGLTTLLELIQRHNKSRRSRNRYVSGPSLFHYRPQDVVQLKRFSIRQVVLQRRFKLFRLFYPATQLFIDDAGSKLNPFRPANCNDLFHHRPNSVFTF